jgi:hypothetical protein
VPLITGSSVPHPTSANAAGEEIVRADRKRSGYANPLVPGSNPGGPTIRTSNKVQRMHSSIGWRCRQSMDEFHRRMSLPARRVAKLRCVPARLAQPGQCRRIAAGPQLELPWRGEEPFHMTFGEAIGLEAFWVQRAQPSHISARHKVNHGAIKQQVSSFANELDECQNVITIRKASDPWDSHSTAFDLDGSDLVAPQRHEIVSRILDRCRCLDTVLQQSQLDEQFTNGSCDQCRRDWICHKASRAVG